MYDINGIVCSINSNLRGKSGTIKEVIYPITYENPSKERSTTRIIKEGSKIIPVHYDDAFGVFAYHAYLGQTMADTGRNKGDKKEISVTSNMRFTVLTKNDLVSQQNNFLDNFPDRISNGIDVVKQGINPDVISITKRDFGQEFLYPVEYFGFDLLYQLQFSFYSACLIHC